MSAPVVSVLMTSYNRENFIADAIKSVLESTYTNFELIIVDDCSTDSTLEIAHSFASKDGRISVYQNKENLGDYPNRNKAAALAKGSYLKYLDSDDLIYKHSLQIMVESMFAFPQAGFGLSANGDNRYPYPAMISSLEAYQEHFGEFGHFNRAPGSSIILKKAFEEVGGFSGKRMIGDNELWFKLARYYPLVKLPRDLVWDRVHAGQESRSGYAKQYEALRKSVLDEALAHQDCPLSEQEIEAIYKSMKRTSIIKKIKKLI